MATEHLMQAAGEYGILGVIIIFLLYWTSKCSAKREERMATRITRLENDLLEQIKLTTEVIANNNTALNEFLRWCRSRGEKF